MMSAGSHTEPGGYTGAGVEKLHRRDKGKLIEISEDCPPTDLRATGQFDIADHRPPNAVAHEIRRLGYEPVWKDWDAALTA